MVTTWRIKLTEEDIEMIKLGKRGLNELTMLSNTYHANSIVDYVFPLLDAIIEEAE